MVTSVPMEGPHQDPAWSGFAVTSSLWLREYPVLVRASLCASVLLKLPHVDAATFSRPRGGGMGGLGRLEDELNEATCIFCACSGLWGIEPRIVKKSWVKGLAL